MSFPGFHAANLAWLFLLAVPLVLFYFLKLRRRKQEISSLVLWHRVLQDHRVNSPFQRFRRNLLLWLQLLLLALCCLAAMQPFFRGKAETAERLPILIDCSASMAALDGPAGRSRLQVALDRARAHVVGLRPGQKICIIAFSNTARRLTAFTGDRQVLHAALDRIRVEDVESDLVDALRMAEALARTESFSEVLLLTDGNVPEAAEFEMPFTVTYDRVPPAGPNLGLTIVSARQSSEAGWEVFVKIEATPGYRGNVRVEFDVGGKVIGSETVSVRQGLPRETVFAFRLDGAIQGDRGSPDKSAFLLEVRLTPEGFDSLPGDNRAFVRLEKPRPLRVFLSPGGTRIRDALPGSSEVRFTEESEALADAPDLVISDRPGDVSLRARTALHMGLVPEDLKSVLRSTPDESRVVDWDRASMLLRHVNLMGVYILDQVSYVKGAGEADVEGRGYRVRVHGHRGPLLVSKQAGESLAFFLLFPPGRSTLPYRLGFPVLFSNLVRLARHRAGLVSTEAARTGVLPPVRLEAGRVYEIRGPDRSTQQVRSDGHGRLAGAAARRVGAYTVTEAGKVLHRVGVALVSSLETRLERREEIRFSEDITVTAAAETMDTDRPFWHFLALAAFGVLVCEWWFYQRRPGGI